VDKLTEALRRNNNFDALRIAAAAAVILGHASELRGHADEMPVVFGIPLTQLAVGVFFVISGYLISGSWQRRPRLPRYLTNRVLRIIPGLLLVVVITAFVLGPLVSALPVGEYFASGGTYSYLSNAVLVPNYALPGVFSGNPYSGAVIDLPISNRVLSRHEGCAARSALTARSASAASPSRCATMARASWPYT